MSEEKDYEEVTKKRTFRDETLKAAHEEFINCAKKGKPMCFRCFKRSFEAQQEEERPRQGVNDERDVKVPVDFKPYQEASRFAKLREKEHNVPKILDGQKLYVVFKYQQWQCRKCGGRIDLEVPPKSAPKG